MQQVINNNPIAYPPATVEPSPVERHRAAILAQRHRLAPAVAAAIAALAFPEAASWAGRRA